MSFERRSSKRVPLGQPAIVSLRRKGRKVENRTGQAISMSSSGLLLECGGDLSVGQNVEVSILWPAKHDGKTSLKLVVLGRIVRCEGDRAAVNISRTEFRTAGKLFGSVAT